MTDLFVQVTCQFTDSNGHFGAGNFEISAAGVLMESASVAIVYPMILGQLDSLGSFSAVGIDAPLSLQNSSAVPNSGIPVLASDNFGMTNGQYNLLYNIKIQVQGQEDIIASNVPILYSSGVTQGLFSILDAAGYSAPPPASFGTG